MIDPYRTLGVTRDAEPEAIRGAYRGLAARHHPDHGGEAERMKAITAAFAILGNPVTRSTFDRAHPVPTTSRQESRPAERGPGCVHHLGHTATGSCWSCGTPTCATCQELRIRLGAQGLCPTCRGRQIALQLLTCTVPYGAVVMLAVLVGHLAVPVALLGAYAVPSAITAGRLGILGAGGGVPVCAPSRADLDRPAGWVCMAVAVLRLTGAFAAGAIATPLYVGLGIVLLAIEIRGAGVGQLMPNPFVGRWRST